MEHEISLKKLLVSLLKWKHLGIPKEAICHALNEQGFVFDGNNIEKSVLTPKYRKGDRIRFKDEPNNENGSLIIDVTDYLYVCNDMSIPIKIQNELEILPKFKTKDRIIPIGKYKPVFIVDTCVGNHANVRVEVPTEELEGIGVITNLDVSNYRLSPRIVEPIFKVGDHIVENDIDECGNGIIKEITEDQYIFEGGSWIHISEQGLWHVVKKKITAYESHVN